MPIKYGELTIIFNEEETTLFTSFLIWLEYQDKPPKKSKYVFLFEDGEICDFDDILKDLKFKFCNNSFSNAPIYFEKNIKCKKIHNKTYFYKCPTQNKNNKPSLDFRNLFSSYLKYSFDTRVASSYNSIYYCYKDLLKQEIFGLVRIKSNEHMPRFQFAYDSDEFTKEEIVYLIHYIFNH
jgi:hypothetical protein